MTNTFNRNTVRDLTPAIGSTVLVRFESIRVLCIVRDAKNSYGQVRLLIEPVAGGGQGQQWVELGRLVANTQEVQ